MLQDTIVVKKTEKFSEYAYEVADGIQGDAFTLEENGTDAEIEARLEVGHSLSDQLNQLNMAIQNNQWKEELEAEINVYNTAITYKGMEGPFRASVADMQETIKLNEELLEVGLPKEDMDLSIQPSIFMKKVVSLFLSTVGFPIILLVLGISITREFEEHNIQMVYALPISRTNYMITKFISLLISGFIRTCRGIYIQLSSFYKRKEFHQYRRLYPTGYFIQLTVYDIHSCASYYVGILHQEYDAHLFGRYFSIRRKLYRFRKWIDSMLESFYIP